MIITIGVASGISHVYMITFIFVLMWCTQCFGYYTEIISRPDPGSDALDKRPRKWLIRNDNPDLLVIPELPAAFQRLTPHFLGYVPYISIWAVFMHSFLTNGDGQEGPPDFVYVIVIGQAVAFTAFGITQLVNQIDENGPSWYMWGEWSYLVLSLVSKGLLGVTLIASVFAYSNFGDAVQDAQ